ncbi:DUF1183-domain-containing protein [Neoconidiobolus thromboides FSU 785]|nr:DUF1183-domain-containing protein [Neoconidiobolus thromboides FSU 785]
MSFESEGTKSKLLLKNIDTLSFIRGRNTKARRLEPISQLTCAGNNIDCDNADIDFVTCHNTYLGEELDSLQYWKCSAEMPTQYSFKDTEVSCEGYSYSGDPHILDGSCGLKYTLNYHPDGKRKGKVQMLLVYF